MPHRKEIRNFDLQLKKIVKDYNKNKNIAGKSIAVEDNLMAKKSFENEVFNTVKKKKESSNERKKQLLANKKTTGPCPTIRKSDLNTLEKIN